VRHYWIASAAFLGATTGLPWVWLNGAWPPAILGALAFGVRDALNLSRDGHASLRERVATVVVAGTLGAVVAVGFGEWDSGTWFDVCFPKVNYDIVDPRLFYGFPALVACAGIDLVVQSCGRAMQRRSSQHGLDLGAALPWIAFSLEWALPAGCLSAICRRPCG
jgi:hypothetical protein